MSEPCRWLSVATVARKIGVSDETVRSWCRLNLINHWRTPKGGYRIPSDTLDTLLARRKKTQNTQAARSQ